MEHCATVPSCHSICAAAVERDVKGGEGVRLWQVGTALPEHYLLFYKSNTHMPNKPVSRAFLFAFTSLQCLHGQLAIRRPFLLPFPLHLSLACLSCVLLLPFYCSDWHILILSKALAMLQVGDLKVSWNLPASPLLSAPPAGLLAKRHLDA